MFQVREYWRRVREIEAGLPECVWIMSHQDLSRGLYGGRIAQVNRQNAARAIAENMARVATDAEVSEYLAEQNERRGAAQIEELRKQGIGLTLVQPPAKNPKERKL